MSPSPPLVVADRYRLVAPIGQGGMGRVWRATDVVLHREVAIKELVPPPGLTPGERQEMRERSLREARAIARLNNINVVRVFDVLSTDADPWIVMEYVASRSLQDTLAQDGPFNALRTAEIGLGVLNALRAAHRNGVMHRDVKPGNVLLGADGRVVLTDFGLATVPGDPNVTRTGLVLGSPAYIAPERARDGTAGPAADLWSLGATLYAAVEGQSPFARPSAIATLAALATENVPVARNAGPLKPVLNGLLRKDPAHRINAEEAERLLSRAAGRRAKITFPMSPTMRRPGAGRERPSLPSGPGGPPVLPGSGWGTATGSAPVVPNPRPPAAQPPAADGRPQHFAQGKAQVGGQMPPETPRRGPQKPLDATRLDTPPVKDETNPAAGTGNAHPPGAGQSSRPGPGQLPPTGQRPGQVPQAGQRPGQNPPGQYSAQIPQAGQRPGQAQPGQYSAQVPSAGQRQNPPGQYSAQVPQAGQRQNPPGQYSAQVPPAGQRPRQAPPGQYSGQAAAGQRPAEAPTENRPGQTPAGQRPGQSPFGQRPGQTPAGQRPDQASAGQRPGQASAGSQPPAQQSGQAAGTPAEKPPAVSISQAPTNALRTGFTAADVAANRRKQAAPEHEQSLAQATSGYPVVTPRNASAAETSAEDSSVSPAPQSAPADEAGAGGIKTGQADAGPVNAGHVETGLANTGNAETGQTDTGQAETGQANPGQVEAGQATSGTVEEGTVESVPKAEPVNKAEPEAAPAESTKAVTAETADEANAGQAEETAAEAPEEPVVTATADSGKNEEDTPEPAEAGSPADGATAEQAEETAKPENPTEDKASVVALPAQSSEAEPPASVPAAKSEPVTEEKTSVLAAKAEPPTEEKTTPRVTPPGEQKTTPVAEEKTSVLAPKAEPPAEDKTSVLTPVAEEKTSFIAPQAMPVAEDKTSVLAPRAGAQAEEKTSFIAPRVTPVAEEKTSVLAPRVTPVTEEKTSFIAPRVTPVADDKTSVLGARSEPVGDDRTTFLSGEDKTSMITPADDDRTSVVSMPPRRRIITSNPEPETRVVGDVGGGPGFNRPARPAWTPMQLRPAAKRGGITIFGTTLTRRQAAIGLGIVLTFLLLVGIIVVQAFGDDEPGDPSVSKAGAASAPAAAPAGADKPAPSSAPSSAAPSSPAATGASIPAGWRTYKGSGFSFPVPDAVRGSNGGTGTTLSWGKGRQIRIDLVNGTTDPVSYLNESDQGGVNETSPKTVDFYGKAAEVEYDRFTGGGYKQHVVRRVFNGGGKTIVLTWYTEASDWNAAKKDLEAIYQGFTVK